MSHYVASAATPTIILLLPDTDGVADTSDYYSIARLAPFQDEALDPLDNFLSSLHNLLLHRRNRFLKTLLNDNSVNRNLVRPEEHTSELQSQSNLVCRLLLEKKKKTQN